MTFVCAYIQISLGRFVDHAFVFSGSMLKYAMVYIDTACSEQVHAEQTQVLFTLHCCCRHVGIVGCFSQLGMLIPRKSHSLVERCNSRVSIETLYFA